jgi:hypothetical protein
MSARNGHSLDVLSPMPSTDAAVRVSCPSGRHQAALLCVSTAEIGRLRRDGVIG